VSAERFTATTDGVDRDTEAVNRRGARRGVRALRVVVRSIGSGLGSLSSPRAMFSASCVAVVNQASGPCWPSMEKMSPNMPPKGLSLIDTI